MEQEITYKKCSKCNIEKPLTNEFFHKQKSNKSGFRSLCKLCRTKNETKTGNNRLDKKITLELGNKYCCRCKKIQPLENFYKKGDFYRVNCKTCSNHIRNEYVDNNREKVNKKKREYDRKKKQDPTYRKELTKQKREYKNKRKKEDPLFKAKLDISKLLWISFKHKNWSKDSKTQEYLGCDWETFKEHIETQFTEGMSWDNQGEWHYDHYYPVSLAQTEEDMYIFNHYTNFQPLWAKDNLSKSNSVPDGFEEWYEMMKEKLSQ